jgi:hypothetical protein
MASDSRTAARRMVLDFIEKSALGISEFVEMSALQKQRG